MRKYTLLHRQGGKVIRKMGLVGPKTFNPNVTLRARKDFPAGMYIFSQWEKALLPAVLTVLVLHNPSVSSWLILQNAYDKYHRVTQRPFICIGYLFLIASLF